MTLTVHRFAPFSTSNGPGRRAVVWLQGCKLHCPGCFNPETHDRHVSRKVDPVALAERINALAVRGVTISGGEPLHQPKSLAAMLDALSADKDILLYSGFSVAEAIRSPMKRAVLLKCDAALMGRYREGDAHPYEGKELVIRTGRIRPDELTPHRIVEVIVNDRQGIMTGFPVR